MAVYRVIVLPASDGVKIAGWAVEKSDHEMRLGVVSPLYSTRAQAKSEAERLNILAANQTGETVSHARTF